MNPPRDNWVRVVVGTTVAALCVFLVIAYGALRVTVGARFQARSEQIAADVMKQGSMLLKRSFEQIADAGRAMACSDALYANLEAPQAGPPGLAAGALPPASPEIQITCLLGLDGKILAGARWDNVANAPAAPPKDLAGPYAAGGFARLASMVAPDAPAKGYVMTEFGPCLAAALPVLKSRMEGPSRGILIVARLVDDPYLRKISGPLTHTLKWENLADNVPRPGEKVLARKNNRYLFHQTDDGGQVREVIQDVLGNPAFTLVMELSIADTESGHSAVLGALGVLGAASAIIGLISAFFILSYLTRAGDIRGGREPKTPFPLLALVVCAGGIFLSLFLYKAVRSIEEEVLERHFNDIAVRAEGLLTQKLAQITSDLGSIRHLYDASQSVERVEFKRFTSGLMAQDPAIRALAWIPRVTSEARADFENRAADSGFPATTFVTMNPEGAFVRVHDKDEYFPVYYLEPLLGNEGMALYDTWLDPDFRPVLESSRDTGSTLVTYVGDREALPTIPAVFLLFAPIYEGGQGGTTVESRRRSLLGFIAGMYATDTVVRQALPPNVQDDISIKIQTNAPRSTNPDRARALHLQPDAPLTSSNGFAFGGTYWTIACSATPGFVERNHSRLSLLVLAISLALSLFVAAGIAIRGRRLHHLQEIIAGHDVPELSRAIRLRWHVQLPAMLALVTLAAAFVAWADVAGRAELRRQLDAARKDAEQVWRAAMEDSGKKLLDRMAEFTAAPGVRDAFIAKDRPALIAAAQLQFQAIRQTENIEALGFFDADGRAVARLHAPDVYGDRSTRPVLERARRTGFACFAPESGPTVTLALAGAYPWRESGQDLGYIVAGIPMVEIVERIESQLSANLLLIVNREVITREGFEREKALGLITTDWDVPSEHVALSSHDAEDLLGLLKDFDALSPDDAPIFRHAPSSNANYYCEAVRIAAIDGSELGHLIVMLDASPLEASQRRTMGILVLLCVLVGIPLALGLSIVTSNIEERLAVTVAAREEAVARVKQLAVEAESASAAKSEFLANISHEIRTPLNGVLGVAGLLSETGLTEVQEKYLDIIRRSGDALLDVISDVLDFSKIEARRIDIQHVDFEPRAVIQQVIELLAVRAEEKGIALRLEVDPGLPEVLRGDPGRIRQVLTNLVANAVKFTEQGHVCLSVTPLPQADGGLHVQFRVEDTGIGIPAAKISLLFTPFMQIDNSATRKYSGTGLGLAISRQLAELMGGHISVESVEGRGSTFSLEVPLQRGESRPPEAPPATKRLRVLLVEDNVVNQMVALAMLRRLGHDVGTAANGREALGQLRASHFDLVVMDCQMPEMDGFEATLAIRSEAPNGPLNPEIPIIAMTAAAAEVDRQRCIDAGMNGYLTKPITQHALAEAIAACMRAPST